MEVPLHRRMAAEVVGTFALTVVAAGVDQIAGLTGRVPTTARAVAPGLVVMAMIYSLSDISGAHLNPAVTLAFGLRGDLPVRRVPAYWAAELSGAILAALALRALFGDIAHVGA